MTHSRSELREVAPFVGQLNGDEPAIARCCETINQLPKAMKVLRRGDEGTEVFEPGRRAKSPVGEAQRFACDDRLRPRQSWIDLLLRWQGSQVADEVVERLQAFRDAGGVVVAIGRSPSAACNGLDDARVRAAVAAIWKPGDDKQGHAALTNYDNIEACLTKLDVPDVHVPSHPKNLLYCHRQLHGKNLYFFANTGAEPVSADVELRGVHGTAMLWNPVTGHISEGDMRKDGDHCLRLRLEFGEYTSTFVVVEPVEPEPVGLPAFEADLRVQMTKLPFKPNWQVSKGTDEYHRVFTAEIKMPADWDTDSQATLILEGASQIIRVKVNDKPVGEQFCPPYSFDVGNALHRGANRIVVERVGRFSPPNPNIPELIANDAAATAPCARATIYALPVHVVEE